MNRVFYQLSRVFSLILITSNAIFGQASGELDWRTPFERDNRQTATYTEGVAFYRQLAKMYPKKVQLTEAGTTDSGMPLHLCVVSNDGDFDVKKIRSKNKLILFINNAIHPGEPEGVDATMMLVRDYLQNADNQPFLKHLVLVVIPFYNVDGVLNRSSFSRANQNGPAAYGFRGNAKNLDLNRDFVKCDTRNAQSFNQIFASWQPDILIDNHTSNGADYQYTMTLIATQKDKLNPQLADYQQKSLLPQVYDDMKKRGWDVCPYVNFDESPDKGISGFLDLPRYSTGYAALHNCIGFMPETHMLKPFPDRVRATYALMDCFIKIMHRDHETIWKAHNAALYATMTQEKFDLNWRLDTSRREKLRFKGFESGKKPSDVSGLPRLYYDRTKPYEKEVPYLPHFNPSVSVAKPRAYVVPQAYASVIERLRWNGVVMTPLSKDTILEAQFYYVTDYQSSATPYEGHHPNRNVKLEKKTLKRPFYKGDLLIELNQPANRYVVETLEPQGADSFFAWNFFDGILNQKEGYSDYVFEDLAAEWLRQNPDLKRKLEEKRQSDPKFAASAEAQLDFVYKNSPYYEPTHRLYPVARVEK